MRPNGDKRSSDWGPRIGPPGAPELTSLVFVIKLEGEFDLADCDRLRDAFGIPTTAGVVVLDLEKTSYIDSSVLQCLVELRQRTLERNATLFLSNLGPGVKRIFEICQLDRIFELEPALGERGIEQVFAGMEIRRLTLLSHG